MTTETQQQTNGKTTCKKCGQTVWWHKSRGGRWYLTQSPTSRNDFHSKHCQPQEESAPQEPTLPLKDDDHKDDGLRCASVVIFRDGVTKAEAQEALEKIAHLLQPQWLRESDKDAPWDKRRFDAAFRVEKYNPEYGHPVFYIP